MTSVTDMPSLARPTEAAWTPTRAQRVASLRAVVLLGGTVRPTALRKMVGRFVLELPVDGHRNILECWHEQVAAMIEYFGHESLPVRIMIDHATPPPEKTHWRQPTELRVERDPLEFRGTGGLLHDLARDYDDDDLLLVASAAQILLEPLPVVADALVSIEGDVRILAQHDGTPSGIMLVRCGCLRSIPNVGFIDLKEQALPAIAKDHKVMLVRRGQVTSLPIRTLSGYLDALREYHRRVRDLSGRNEPMEDWQPTFRVVEDGAQVSSDAVIHDSVVLSGGVVESEAVLVRSVVCPAGRIGPGWWAVDRLVTERDFPGALPYG